MTEENKKYRKGDGFDAWWEDRSIPQKVLVVIGFIILGVGLLFLFGFVVRLLWNWLMPELFGLKKVTYWQAWGLLLLCSILFKGIKIGDENRRTEKKRKRKLRDYMRDDLCSDTESSSDSPDTAGV